RREIASAARPAVAGSSCARRSLAPVAHAHRGRGRAPRRQSELSCAQTGFRHRCAALATKTALTYGSGSLKKPGLTDDTESEKRRFARSVGEAVPHVHRAGSTNLLC